MFRDLFKNSKVLITGHTGFKGSWLSLWLKKLGSDVLGISLEPITNPNHFDVINLKKNITDVRIDICNLKEIKKTFIDFKPDFVFHLAAQSLVKNSIDDPINTWKTNVIGTLNIIESLRSLNKSCVGVIITSDKSYLNKEFSRGYREDDELGGLDPYSGSKGAAEFVIRSHKNTFFNSISNTVFFASARAGNVIGGGDWSLNRIVPDCIKAINDSKKVIIRNPQSTRPWQHVLEPLSGYLQLASYLRNNSKLHGETFNFGPQSNNEYNVLKLVNEMKKNWDSVNWEIQEDQNFKESNLLKLNCEKAQKLLKWKSTLNFKETVNFTISWYKKYYNNSSDVNISSKQIDEFTEIAKKRGMDWTL